MMSKKDCETLDLMFLHCDVAKALQCDLLTEAYFAWVLPERCEALLIEKPISFGKSKMEVVMCDSVVMAIF